MQHTLSVLVENSVPAKANGSPYVFACGSACSDSAAGLTVCTKTRLVEGTKMASPKT